MARKVFWVLWMTVWPIVALVPPLVKAQASWQQPTGPASHFDVGPVSHRLAGKSTHSGPVDRLASATESRVVLSTAPHLSVDQAHDPKAPELIDPASPTSLTQQKPSDPVANEQLPPARDQQKIVTRRPVNTTAPAYHRSTGIESAIQEEQAQKLIHERALQRGLERHARLEMKYRRVSGQNPATASTRWQPHLSETNWMAGARRSAKP